MEGNLLESPATEQTSAWVWLKTLQQLQCRKARFPFSETLLQLGWVSPARGTLPRQESGGDGGGTQEDPVVTRKAFLAGGWQKEKREGDFRVPLNKHNVDCPRPIAEMSHGADGVGATGGAMVAPCSEMSWVANTFKKRVRQRMSLC